MKFSITELRVHKTLQKSDQFDPVLLLGPAPELISYSSPVSAHVQAELITAEILVTGDVKTEIQNTCSRCLTTFKQPIEGQFRQSFDINEDSVDVTDFIKEGIVLNLPLKALCKPSCKGLCATCGGNRNEKDCRCVIDNPASPWKVLKDFKAN